MFKSLLCFLLVQVAICQSSEVDTLNILFPEAHHKDQGYSLQIINAEGGCYSWSSSQPEVVSVKILEANKTTCSKKSLVQLHQSGVFASSIYITAIDDKTESILKIPVRVRKLHKISIFTKSRMMNIREVQKIQIYGFDQDNNTFTSLQGLRFKWFLEQTTQIIEKVELKHAQLYLPLKIRENLQNKGFQTDLLVVKALRPGNLVIRAQCIEKDYEHVTDSITLSVHQRFELIPNTATYLLIGSKFQFALYRPSGELISLPQSYYKVTVNSLFDVSDLLLMTSPSKKTETILKVEDIRTKPPYSSQVKVYVEEPDEIKLFVEDNIIVGEPSLVRVELLYKGIVLKGYSDEIKIESDFTFDKKSMSIEGSTKKTGIVKATFRNLKTQKTVNCNLPIEAVLPSHRVVLPLNQQFQLKIIGGSGIYDYSLSTEIASTSAHGMIIAKYEGESDLWISDRKNPRNKLKLLLVVSPIKYISSLQKQKELNINENGQIYMLATTEKRQYYTQCDQSKMSLLSTKNKFDTSKRVNVKTQIQHLSKLAEDSTILSKKLFQTSLLKRQESSLIKRFAKYVDVKDISEQQLKSYVYSLQNYGICDVIDLKYGSPFDEPIDIVLKKGSEDIKQRIPLRVYETLMNSIEGDSRQFLMTPLSGIHWRTRGGSYNWQGSQKQTFLNNRLSYEDNPFLYCPNSQKKVEFGLTYMNKQTELLLFPVKQSQVLILNCKFPSELKLKFEKENLNSHLLNLNPNTIVNGYVIPVDEKGQLFYNYSNLQYEYKAEKGKVTNNKNNFTYKNGVTPQKDKVQISTSKIANSSIRFDKVSTFFEINYVPLLELDHPLKTLKIISPFTPKKEYRVNLKNGHELIDVHCKDSVQCQFNRRDNSIPIHMKSLGHGQVFIRDRRVYGMPEIKIEFEIVEIDKLKIQTDRTSLPEGDQFTVSLHLYSRDQLINPSLYEQNYLKLHHSNKFKFISQDKNKFLLKAYKEGTFTIQGENSLPKTLLSENSVQIYVYPKIQVNLPISKVVSHQNILFHELETSIIESCFKILKFSGGPIGMKIQYEIVDNSIVSVTAEKRNSFHIHGKKKGNTIVKFNALFEGNIISKFQISVTTKIVESLEILGNSNLFTSAQFRLLPNIKVEGGSNEGSICEFDYEWSSSASNVVSLGQSFNIYPISGAGINATAQTQGQSKITLTVKNKNGKSIASAFKNIAVNNAITLKYPTFIAQNDQKSNSLLIPPYSGYKIQKQYTITKIPCNQGGDVVEISNNVVSSSKKKGTQTLKLSKLINGQTITSPLNIQIADITSVFIENQNGLINIGRKGVKKSRFYVQDQYGRLFFNNLQNINYRVSVANPDILQAQISSDKQFIYLTANEEGQTLLTLEIDSKNIKDIVPVRIGTIIRPSSPVYVHQGGIVKFSLKEKMDYKWASTNPKVAKIDENTGVVQAIQVGSTQIIIDGIKSALKVVKIAQFKKLNDPTSKQLNSYKQFSLSYMPLWKINGELHQLYNIKDNDQIINNNLNLNCRAVQRKWFEIETLVEDSGEYQIITCVVRPKQAFQAQAVPKQLTIQIINLDTNEVFGQFAYPYKFRFVIPQKSKFIQLSQSKPAAEIQIKTNEKLSITVVKGDNSWVSTQLKLSKGVQLVKINVPADSKQKDGIISIQNLKTGHIQEIPFTYRLQDNQSTSKPSSTKTEKSGSSSSFFSTNLDWPDLLIIVMAVSFAILCILQYLSDGGKLKAY